MRLIYYSVKPTEQREGGDRDIQRPWFESSGITWYKAVASVTSFLFWVFLGGFYRCAVWSRVVVYTEAYFPSQ